MTTCSHNKLERTDVLIFVEDPGAAGYVAALPEVFKQHGILSRLVATGRALEILRQRRVAPESLPEGTSARQMLEEINPRLLLVGTAENPGTIGLPLIKEARKIGLISIGAVDATTNASYRFRGQEDEPLANAPDWLLLPEPAAKKAFVSLGYPPKRAIVCGHPHYDYVISFAERLGKTDFKEIRRRTVPQAPEGLPVLVFSAEISAGFDAHQFQRSAEYTLTGTSGAFGRTEIVLEELLNALLPSNRRPYMVLRLHPKNDITEFARYKNQFDCISQGGSPLELIYAADLVVGMTSTLLMEAALMGKRTLSILPRNKEASWLPAISKGMIDCVTTRHELKKRLEELLWSTPQNTPSLGPLLPIRYAASERISALILKLLGNFNSSGKTGNLTLGNT